MTTHPELRDVAELKRRIRRLLSVIRSIAAHMNTQAIDPRDSALHLAGRVGAIGRAAIASVSGGMDLESLVLDELLACGSTQRAPLGVSGAAVRGPAVCLNPRSAELMSLAIHELATNSVKYGALSQPAARLRVTWWLTDPPGPRLHFEWAEQGVRMTTGAGHKAGFGSELLSRLIATELRGSGEMLFLPEGVLCSIQIPLIEALHLNE
jgi:two-component system, chemotaxis family, CheB/CheR fusion protein